MVNCLKLAITGLLLSGCVPTVTGSTYYDGRFWYSNVKSASDIAGGPRQDLIIIIDRDGRIAGTMIANSVGTAQSIASSLGPAIVTAGGVVAGNALIRPARNTTNVEMNVQGTGGAGGTGGVSTTSSTANSTGNTTATTVGGTATSP